MAWPVFQSVYPTPFEAFAAICVNAGTNGRYQFGIKVVERTLLHEAMNQIARLVVDTPEIAALIVFDDDCRPPLDCVSRLLAHLDAGRDFVAGVGFMRNFPHSTTVGRYFPEGQTLVPDAQGTFEIRGLQWLDEIDRLPPLAEVDFCGVPVALFSRRCFEVLPYPWFQNRDEEGGSCTHDIYFCKQAKKAGIPVLVDTTIRCDHLAAAPWITFENRRVIRQMEGKTATDLVEALK